RPKPLLVWQSGADKLDKRRRLTSRQSAGRLLAIFGGCPFITGVFFPMRDAMNRPLRDLRISVTDRCNFRCTYCMPREIFGADFPFLRREELLSFEEITRAARLFVASGVEKIRITGG